jgi:hypothetical protein
MNMADEDIGNLDTVDRVNLAALAFSRSMQGKDGYMEAMAQADKIRADRKQAASAKQTHEFLLGMANGEDVRSLAGRLPLVDKSMLHGAISVGIQKKMQDEEADKKLERQKQFEDYQASLRRGDIAAAQAREAEQAAKFQAAKAKIIEAQQPRTDTIPAYLRPDPTAPPPGMLAEAGIGGPPAAPAGPTDFPGMLEGLGGTSDPASPEAGLGALRGMLGQSLAPALDEVVTRAGIPAERQVYNPETGLDPLAFTKAQEHVGGENKLAFDQAEKTKADERQTKRLEDEDRHRREQEKTAAELARIAAERERIAAETARIAEMRQQKLDANAERRLKNDEKRLALDEQRLTEQERHNQTGEKSTQDAAAAKEKDAQRAAAQTALNNLRAYWRKKGSVPPESAAAVRAQMLKLKELGAE